MGVKDRKERQKAELRSKIIDAARELFATKGVDAVTMREIAERIEYTPTSIYLHFKDKRALLLEICRIDFGRLAGALGEIQSIPDPLTRLRKLGAAYVSFGVAHPHHYSLMFMTQPEIEGEHYSFSGLELPDQTAYGILVDCVKAALAAGCFRPEIKDPYLVAQVLWAVVHGLVALEIVKHEAEWLQWRDLKERTVLALESVIRGMIKE